MKGKSQGGVKEGPPSSELKRTRRTLLNVAYKTIIQVALKRMKVRNIDTERMIENVKMELDREDRQRMQYKL